LLARTHDEAGALKIVRQAIAANSYDFDLVNTGFTLAARAGDYELAEKAIRLRISGWPSGAAGGYVQLGTMLDAGVRDPKRALEAFTQARQLAQPGEWESISRRVPAPYRASLGLPPASAPQISASKG